MNSRTHARARFALEIVRRGTPAADSLRVYVDQLPPMLRTNGLGQTVAYLTAKRDKDDGARILLDALEEWLCGGSAGSRDRYPERLFSQDLLGAIRSRAGDEAERRDRYMRATTAAFALCEWLKPLAAVYLEKRPEDNR